MTPPPNTALLLRSGYSTRQIATELKNAGVIRNAFAFRLWHRFHPKPALKAGEYLFPKGASVKDVVETIVEGKVVQHQLTIPEGLTSEQIVARLLESDILSGNVKDVPREGSLLPDSYHFNRGFTREQMIQRMRQAQQRAGLRGQLNRALHFDLGNRVRHSSNRQVSCHQRYGEFAAG